MISMKVMNYHQKVWKVCGIWTHPDQPCWYPVYAVLLFGIVYVIFPMCIVLNLLWVTSLNQVIETLLICSTCVLAAFKGLCILSKKRQLLDLFQIVHKMDDFLKTEEQRDIVRGAVKQSMSLVYLLSACYYGGCNAALLLTLFTPNWVLLWPSWYPWIHYESGDRTFFALLVYQYICSHFMAFMDTACDVFGSALNKVLGAHLDALGLRLRHLGVGGSSVGDRRKWELELNDCVEYYGMCIKYSKSLDEILSVVYMVQFACSGLIICVSAFQLSVVQPLKEFSKFTFVCEYLFSMTIQIFIPCYYGSIVTMKSQLLSSQIFASNWIEQSAAFHSSMRIFVQRSLRPIVPYAGRLIVIGLPTFVSILRAAYSMLSLLKSIEN